MVEILGWKCWFKYKIENINFIQIQMEEEGFTQIWMLIWIQEYKYITTQI